MRQPVALPSIVLCEAAAGYAPANETFRRLRVVNMGLAPTLTRVQIVEEIHVLDVGGARLAPNVKRALDEIRIAIASVVWPPGSDSFTVHPESGKKSGEGNGVRPIRDAFVIAAEELGWTSESPFPLSTPPGSSSFGSTDAAKEMDTGAFLVEWETGNISSSHRSMNKMALALSAGVAVAAVLIVPSSRLAKYLTDRIGNDRELRPYVQLWSSVRIERGYLGIIVVEHDDESLDVPKIRKGTDGRALR